ncbi:hypothetical protein AB0D62_38220 [Streptomyces massasporeus]|uniref:hypothetical protein n=1 Tax=Streptomyces massasporeus TaxID=67324 RepID=UPI0033D057D6
MGHIEQGVSNSGQSLPDGVGLLLLTLPASRCVRRLVPPVRLAASAASPVNRTANCLISAILLGPPDGAGDDAGDGGERAHDCGYGDLTPAPANSKLRDLAAEGLGEV